MVLASSLALVGCSKLPRGAPLVSEVLDDSDRTKEDFSVYRVSQANYAQYNTWPHSHELAGQGWLSNIPASDLMIRAGDTLTITVWDAAENSLLTTSGEKVINIKSLPVERGGDVFIPYVDYVPVAGLTQDQARLRIQGALTAIIPSAQVQLVQVAGRSNTIDLLGSARTPGRFPLPATGSSVLELVAQGGGIMPNLRNPHLRLVRAGKSYVVAFDDLYSKPNMDVDLMGGDKVIVEESMDQFIAFGALGSERAVPLPRNHVSALEAIALVGGVSEVRADLAGVLILRQYAAGDLGNGQTGPALKSAIFVLDLTSADGLFSAGKFLVNPNDVVFATESPVVATSQILDLSGLLFGQVRVINQF
jgi:polysaccharide export outer membrane protein